MAAKPGPSGCSGPALFPYHKRGVKYTTMAFTADTLDKIPKFRMSSEDVVVATSPKAGELSNYQIEIYMLKQVFKDNYIFS